MSGPFLVRRKAEMVDWCDVYLYSICHLGYNWIEMSNDWIEKGFDWMVKGQKCNGISQLLEDLQSNPNLWHNGLLLRGFWVQELKISSTSPSPSNCSCNSFQSIVMLLNIPSSLTSQTALSSFHSPYLVIGTCTIISDSPYQMYNSLVWILFFPLPFNLFFHSSLNTVNCLIALLNTHSLLVILLGSFPLSVS